MKISKLKHYITVEYPICSNDEIGGQETYWLPLCTIASAVKTYSHDRSVIGEVFVAMQLQSISYSKFTVRYRDDITNKMRILFNKKIYAIHNIVNENEDNLILSIFCRHASI